MNYLVIGLASALAAGLTLFSGFGLGTLLMPVMALFFPVPSAVALTAVVHLANNLLKLALLGRHVDRGILVRFGLPALVAAPVGALGLMALARVPPMASYHFLGAERVVTAVKLVIAVLMLAFAAMDGLPRFKRLALPARWLPVGGVLSGFFGGLSGHQGAFRSAFLAKSGLSTEAFLGTGVVIAVLVDLARLAVYAGNFQAINWAASGWALGCATAAALAGTWITARWVKKITIEMVQATVAILLVVIALGLASGLI